MKLRRYEGNPILKPKPENDWESENVFNPAVVYDKGLFYVTYTAYSDNLTYYGGADRVVCVATVDKEEKLGIF
jgi:predicted GH43/DUF377 family glycosyl hydrolase